MYAVKDHVQGLHLPDELPTVSVATFSLATFLPSIEDCVALCEEFIVLFVRVLIQYLPWFRCLKPAVPDHKAHKAMAEKSEIVSAWNEVTIRYI